MVQMRHLVALLAATSCNEPPQILENLETYAQNRALILYACPAFFKKEELYEHIVNSSVIASTNYVKPTKLKDHKKYTFLTVLAFWNFIHT